MPRAFKCNPCPRFRLPGLRRVRQDFGEQVRRRTEGKGLVRSWANRLGKERALGGHRRKAVSVENRLHLFDGHHAMMFAMHPATSRKSRLGGAPRRKQRRDLRKAEEQQQRDGYGPSHERGFEDTSISRLRRRDKVERDGRATPPNLPVSVVVIKGPVCVTYSSREAGPASRFGDSDA